MSEYFEVVHIMIGGAWPLCRMLCGGLAASTCVKRFKDCVLWTGTSLDMSLVSLDLGSAGRNPNTDLIYLASACSGHLLAKVMPRKILQEEELTYQPQGILGRGKV